MSLSESIDPAAVGVTAATQDGTGLVGVDAFFKTVLGEVCCAGPWYDELRRRGVDYNEWPALLGVSSPTETSNILRGYTKLSRGQEARLREWLGTAPVSTANVEEPCALATPSTPAATAADLPAPVQQIKAAHAAVGTAYRAAVAHALEAGVLLLQAKGMQVSERSAQISMRRAREVPKLPPDKSAAVADLTPRDAVAPLAFSSGRLGRLPAGKAAEGLAAAEEGEPLKRAVNQAELRQHLAEQTPWQERGEWTTVNLLATQEPRPETEGEKVLRGLLWQATARALAQHPDLAPPGIAAILYMIADCLQGEPDLWASLVEDAGEWP